MVKGEKQHHTARDRKRFAKLDRVRKQTTLRPAFIDKKKLQTIELTADVPAEIKTDTGDRVKVWIRGGRKRRIPFTLNNPTEDELEHFEDLADDDFRKGEFIDYIIGQAEDNGTYHIQGYAEFSKELGFNRMKEAISGSRRGHLERMKGTQQQNIDYCRKKKTRIQDDDDRHFMFEYGKPKAQGKTKDSASNVMHSIRQGMNLDDIKDQFPGQFLMRGDKIRAAYIAEKPERNLPVSKKNNIILYGKTGTGKTATAMFWADKGSEPAYRGVWPGKGQHWFPMYEGQKHAVWDEFNCQIPYREMCNLLDRKYLTVQFKGGHTRYVTEKNYITTTLHPKDWYRGVKNRTELARRIREYCTIYEFVVGFTYPNFCYREIISDNFEYEILDFSGKDDDGR